MFDDPGLLAPRLLVVDDETVICHACRRVFSRQGFQVEESTDAVEGLTWATEQDYTAILLDIKMPVMDGIEFLEELRKKKPDVPVILITGYPSIPNAASAIRLGASDYVTKPFTPEEITQAVQKTLTDQDKNGNRKYLSSSAPPPIQAWAPRAKEFLFLNESWCQLEEDGSACVGALLGRPPGAMVQAVRLPRIGEAVYQGLPLAGLTMGNQHLVTVPAPVSGVVIAVNELLTEDPSAALNDPFGKGWIACICTTRFEEEADNCKPRRVILFNADSRSAHDQCKHLASLGCQVRTVKSWEELSPILEEPDCGALLIDAFRFGEHGPELVGRINAAAPSMRIVVVASPESRWEAAYRERKIFYYAVEPFADNEIIDILDALYRPQAQPPPQKGRGKTRCEAVSGIRIKNRNGHKVHLLAAPGLLKRSNGLGGQIRHKLADQMFPIVTTSGDADITPTDILKTTSTCDRLLVLLAKDTGRLPASLVHDTKAEFFTAPAETAGKVTTLVLQPQPGGTGCAEFDDRTTAALAEYIVREMASY